MKEQRRSGFTIVEVLVVIVVIAILASISYFAIESWRTDTANTQVKNELIHATNALNNTRNFTSTYPTSAQFPSIYSTGADVTLSYTRRLNDTFCLNGTSQAQPNVRWNVDSNVTTEPRSGVCVP